MSKRAIASVATLLLAGNLWAGDPWRNKPYNQWDEKDVRKVMTESPWVRTVSVERIWSEGGALEAPTLGASGSAASSEPRDITRGAKPLTEGRPEAIFALHWASSRTIRRAQARNAVLQHRVLEADAEKFLAQEPTEYRVVVLGSDMTPFSRAAEKDLREMKEKSYLAPKKSKARLAPEHIEIERTGDGTKVLAVHFYFAKRTAAGEPTLTPEEKGAEFSCLIGKTTLKDSFEFQKMTDNQGVDL